MLHLRALSFTACLALLLGSAHAQLSLCPDEPVQFELEDTYHGEKTWEFSADGVNWEPIEVVEDTPFTLQPEQHGWYRVRFYDADCDSNYVSNTVRLATHAIDVGDAITVAIGGVVRNELGGPVSGVTVRAGCGAGVSTTTDHFGVFLLQGVAAYEGLAHVSVEKDGYFTGSRSFVPGENAGDAISHAYITLLQKNLAGTVDGATGGEVSLEDVTITFPENAFVQNGQPYSGEVSVSLNHIDPTSEDLHAQMPGMLMGVMDEEPQLLLSYGMVGVELSDEAGQPVELAPGSPATVRFPVMPDQQADAPEVMPLWWFDEELGYWVQEGEALLVGDEYVGQVAHFSWWNCDIPSNFVEIKGPVIDLNTGVQLANAQVVIITETLGTGITYTNGLGDFSGLVPIGQELTIQVWLPCGVLGAYEHVHEVVVGPFEVTSIISIEVDVPWPSFIIGTVLDCEGDPIEQGYVWANGQPVFCTAGAYHFPTCAESVSLRGVDLLAGNASEVMEVALTNDTTTVEDLITCTPFFSTVTDIDGNSYQTVIIGYQEWMAEGLRTGSYSNGEPIPNVTEAYDWTQWDTGGWCSYDNDPSFDVAYGRLYNWYTVVDPRGMCPLGWHVPTHGDQQELELSMGVPAPLVEQFGLRAAEFNPGGKLKTTDLWDSPNSGATNESGFSARPSGVRISIDGDFVNMGNTYSWWGVDSTVDENYGFCQSVTKNSSGIFKGFGRKKDGQGVRCLKD